MFRNSFFTKTRSLVIKRNTFLGTVVPKPSIKNQFVLLQIRKLEQLVPFLAMNDHFVPKKQNLTLENALNNFQDKTCNKNKENRL